MKNKLSFFVIIGVVFSLVGCSSDYIISTNDGHMMTTHGKPVIDKDTGLISYKDQDGSTHQIHKNDVREIVEK